LLQIVKRGTTNQDANHHEIFTAISIELSMTFTSSIEGKHPPMSVPMRTRIIRIATDRVELSM
jgi:hypothetical protein